MADVRHYQNHAAGGMNGVHIAINESGKILFIDPQTSNISDGQLPGKVIPPLAVSVSQDPNYEMCVVVDGAGSVWTGTVRGGEFKQLR